MRYLMLLLALGGLVLLVLGLIPGEAAHLARGAGNHCATKSNGNTMQHQCSTGEIKAALLVGGGVLFLVGSIVASALRAR